MWGQRGGLECRWGSAACTHTHPLRSQELFLPSHSHSFILPASQPASKYVLRTYCIMLVAKPPIDPLMLDTLNESPHEAVNGQTAMEIYTALSLRPIPSSSPLRHPHSPSPLPLKEGALGNVTHTWLSASRTRSHICKEPVKNLDARNPGALRSWPLRPPTTEDVEVPVTTICPLD